LLALGLIVLVDGEIDREAREAIAVSGFAVVDAGTFSDAVELVEYLRTIDVLAAVEEGQR